MTFVRFLVLPAVIVSVCFGVSFRTQAGFKCTECHSKNPATVLMHQAVQGRNCFICHKRGEKLRQKGGIPPEKHQAFLRQRVRDPRCIECHAAKSGKAVINAESRKRDERATVKKKGAPISGSFYCPRCRIKTDKNVRTCPKCGDPMMDMDKTMRRSALNPSQEICRMCHPMAASLLTEHESKNDSFDPEQDCLSCHSGHNECASCHK